MCVKAANDASRGSGRSAATDLAALLLKWLIVDEIRTYQKSDMTGGADVKV